jgi:hypothetical protein
MSFLYSVLMNCLTYQSIFRSWTAKITSAARQTSFLTG